MGFLRSLQLSLFGPSAPPPQHVPVKEVVRQKRVIIRRPKLETLNQVFQSLMSEICASVGEFSRFEMNRIEVSVGASRSGSKHGIWAYVTPLRYVGGSLYRRGLRRGIPGSYTYSLADRNLEDPSSPLYLITILVPRYFVLSFEERLETLVHELYHLHPDFRGDLRRFPKPHIHHGPTPAAYNARVRELVEEALRNRPALREHPLLVGAATDFELRKKRRVSRPTLKFVPKLLPALLAFGLSSFAFAQSRAPAASEPVWNWPWEDAQKKKKDPDDPLQGELDDYDTREAARRKNPRFIVSPTESVNLKTAPSEWAASLPEVRPGENFLAFSMDTTGEWVFLRSRRLQGWLRLDKVQLVGQLQSPEAVGGFGPTAPRSSGSPNVTSRTLLDGDPIFIPGEGDIGESDLLNFDKDLDTVIATNPGPLYEQPDPLAVRYGSIQAGDKVLILKRGSKGDWSYIRLLLTNEEGWFPSEWLRINRGARVKGAGLGSVVVDLDGAYGTTGRGYGLGLGAYYNIFGKSTANRIEPRLELGVFYQNFGGESLSYISPQGNETYTLNASYQVLGGGLRWISFATGGFLGGGLEGAASYQLTNAELTGLSEAIIAESGIRNSLRPRIGIMLGARGILSVTSWLQVNALVRANLASESNLFWGGMGLSFRIF